MTQLCCHKNSVILKELCFLPFKTFQLYLCEEQMGSKMKFFLIFLRSCQLQCDYRILERNYHKRIYRWPWEVTSNRCNLKCMVLHLFLMEVWLQTISMVYFSNFYPEMCCGYKWFTHFASWNKTWFFYNITIF